MALSTVFGTYRDITTELTTRIAPRLEAGEALEILIPSRAVAASITAALLEQLPRGFSGLSLLTPDALARKLLNARGEFPHAASDDERRLAMAAAAAGLDHPALRIGGIAAMLDRTYRDMRDSGLSIDLFAAQAKRTRDGGRTKAVTAAWRRYEQNLLAIRAVDPADILERGAGIASAAQPQIVFGFYDMTGVQEKLLRALVVAGRVESIFVPVPLRDSAPEKSYRFATPFVSRLLKLDVEVTALPASEPASWTLSAHESVAAELRSVCRSARALISGGLRAADIAIAVRSVDRLEAETLARVAREFELPVAITRTLDLRAHRFGRAIDRLLRLRADNFPRGQVIEILRDGLRLDGVTQHAIDNADRATREAEIAGGPPELVKRALAGTAARKPWLEPQIAPFVRWVSELWDLTAPFSKPRRGRDWAATLRTLQNRFRAETDSDLGALESLDSIADLLARADAFGNKFTADEVASMIEKADPIVIDAPQHGVWFGDVMSLRGRSFDTVFLIGMQQERFPQRRVEDPLLADSDRRAVGMPVIGDGREEEELLFAVARAAARRHIEAAFASADLSGKLLGASAFVQRLAYERERDPKLRPSIYRDFAAYVRTAFAQPPSAPASNAEMLRRTLRENPGSIAHGAPLRRGIRNALRAGERSEYDAFLTLDDSMAARLREIIAKVSPTSLEDFGDCPHKFFIRRVLEISELADPDHEAQMEVRDKGTLDHEILERFYRGAPPLETLKHPELPRLSAKGRERLAQIVEEVFDAFDAARPPFNATIRRIERSISLRGLERFLGRDLQDLEDRRLTPTYLEYAFGTDRGGVPDHPDPVALKAADVEFAIGGRIDRIDVGEGGRHRIVDYKSWASNRYVGLEEQIVTGRRIQLALYAIAIQSIFGLPDEALSGVIKGIRGEKDLEKLSFELADSREALVEALEAFAVAMSRGQFPALPDDETCKYCAVNYACRARYDAGEMRNAAEYENALELIRRL